MFNNFSFVGYTLSKYPTLKNSFNFIVSLSPKPIGNIKILSNFQYFDGKVNLGLQNLTHEIIVSPKYLEPRPP